MLKARVVVVGAGLAGLAAAKELSNCGFDVLVLEADGVAGGRIRNVTGLVPWPVEVGPEFLHGKQNSSIKHIADELGCEMRELSYPDFYYIGSERRLLTAAEAEHHQDIVKVHEMFSELAGESHPMPDINMLEFLKKKSDNATVLQLAQSVYANDFGCSLHELGVGECIDEAKQWIYGDAYLILDRPLSCVIDHLSGGLKVLLRHAVEEILYSSDTKVQVKCKGGAEFETEKVILTVPLKVLSKQMIKFNPPLPKLKIEAARTIGMSNAIKVLVAVSHTFWPEEMFHVVCTDFFMPELWTTMYPPSVSTESETAPPGKFLLVGFIAGEAAEEMSNLSHTEILSRTLMQLDQMFGDSFSGVIPEPRTLVKCSKSGFYLKDKGAIYSATSEPASFFFQAGLVMDWSKEEYIGGGYTHPSINAQGARQALARPVSGRLFFAGEATHPGVNPCMQAAIDTGLRAAEEIKNTLKADATYE